MKIEKSLKHIFERGINKYVPFLKKNLKYIILAMFIVLLALGYLFGRVNIAKDDVLKDLEIALKNDDEEALSKIVYDNGKRVDKEKLVPLIDYYDEDSYKVDSTISSLRKESESTEFVLTEKNGFLGKKYILEIKKFSLTVTSNFEEGKFKIDNSDEFSASDTVEDILPGIYNLEGKLESSYGDINNSKQILIMSDKTENLNFDAVNITIETPYKDADLYINDEKTDIKIKDAKNIGPFPTDESVSMHIEMDTSWGRLIGDEVKITNVPNVYLNLKIENEELKEKLKSNVTEFYQSVFEALNEGNKEKIKLGTTATKEKIYDIIEKKYIILKNKYTISDIKVIDDKSLYEYKDDKYRATIVVNVDYKVSKKLFNINTSEDSKMFFTRLVYEDDEWKIEDVENFEL